MKILDPPVDRFYYLINFFTASHGGSLQRTQCLKIDLAKHTALPYNLPVEFIEAVAFTKHVYDYLSEDEYLGLQSFLLLYPESGKIIPGSGGV
jgi:hypothetical protein